MGWCSAQRIKIVIIASGNDTIIHRWHGEAVTEEGSTDSPKHMQFGRMIPRPLQSKIKDFCQLPQRGSLGRYRASAINPIYLYFLPKICYLIGRKAVGF